jgi:hypothetical protein
MGPRFIEDKRSASTSSIKLHSPAPEEFRKVFAFFLQLALTITGRGRHQKG